MATIPHLLDFLRAHPEPAAARAARRERNDAVIETLARAVVDRRLESPAVLFLELNRPIGFLFSQAAFFARPFLSFFLPVHEVEAAAEVLDDPAALERLIGRIGELSAEEKC